MHIRTNIADLRQMAEITSDIDDANSQGEKQAISTLVEKLHATIEQMLGVHADKVYLLEDEPAQTGERHDH